MTVNLRILYQYHQMNSFHLIYSLFLLDLRQFLLLVMKYIY